MVLTRLKNESITLSSKWYKRYKLAYWTLVFDTFFLIGLSFLALKDFLIGYFNNNFSTPGILIAIMINILIFLRFNISLLLFSKQRFGIYISIFYILCLFLIDNFSYPAYPILHFFQHTIEFFNKYIFNLPNIVNIILQYALYFYFLYIPIMIYLYLIVAKYNFNKDVRKFHILTGFYVSELSSKLRIMDIFFIAAILGLSLIVGLICPFIAVPFVVMILSLYLVKELIKRFNLNSIISKKQKIIVDILCIICVLSITLTQRIPYWGLIAFIFSFIVFLLVLIQLTKCKLKSTLITIFAIFFIPVISLGYNIFIYPQYGVISKSEPTNKEKLYFEIKDKEGMIGIRGRAEKIIIPTYTKLMDNGNEVFLQRKDGLWDIYTLSSSSFAAKEVII